MLSFLFFSIKDFNFFNALFIIPWDFNESLFLCKSWSNFARIVIRISGIPSSASFSLLNLSDSVSINNLNIIFVFHGHRYQFLDFYYLLLPKLIDVLVGFFYKSVSSFSEFSNNLFLDILRFLF